MAADERTAAAGLAGEAGRARTSAGVLGRRLALLRKALPGRVRLLGGLEHAALAVTAALLAYLPPKSLHQPESFWAAITAIAVVQTEYSAARSTARDQATGAAIGGVVGVAVALAAPQNLPAYGLGVALAVMACWLLNVASAARLAGITATIILLVPHMHASAEHMMLARVGEVGWGVTVALVVVRVGLWVGTRSKVPGG